MDFIVDVFNGIGKLLGDLINTLIGWLPDSPFVLLDNSVISEYLGYINWVVPFDFAILTLSVWLPCVALYYVYSVALRWARVIE